jgi:hypothetical protein
MCKLERLDVGTVRATKAPVRLERHGESYIQSLTNVVAFIAYKGLIRWKDGKMERLERLKLHSKIIKHCHKLANIGL